MVHYLSVMMAVSDIFLLLDGSAEAHAKKAELWQYLKDHVTPGVYRAVRVNLGGLTDLHFPGGDKVVVATYRQLRKIFKFKGAPSVCSRWSQPPSPRGRLNPLSHA